ncbi:MULTISPECIES: MerR family transcriptional regulator [unclassified Plantactinospora]|uniref:MerR family transcriptional regulator n=1 Tax=unclassified Plantactinospora TaxID=2631981 RepID=UPI0029824977|nr:MerR family transcriptional regulator [Plantactinospora sp. KLBMP9567]MDW5330622.1 MerR family transcriptional regulator [Plantactinospora sp. KLBMP9567]
MRIGEVAAQAGVSPRTVDFYTSLDLIAPAARSGGNYRLYDPEVIERITTIRALEAHGVPLQEIAAALRQPVADDLDARLDQLDNALHALQAAARHSDEHAHGLLTAITTRAHALIATALDLTAGLPPPA